jgi:putative selenium metabolism hydrolase
MNLDPAVAQPAVVGTALSLIGARSHSGDEGTAAALLAELLRSADATVEVDGYGSVTGSWDFGPGPAILFESHLDTVPVADADRWSRDPSGEVADGMVFGRGAVDMKGPIAACLHGIAALRHGHHAGRIIVSGSVAEELAEGPALNKVVEAVQPDAVVICEPSRARVAVGQRGRAEVTVEARGVSAHSADPQAGRNAAEAMAGLVVALRSLRMPSHAQLGDGLLVLTGVASEPFPSLSVVPDRCSASFDRRTLPGESLDDVLGPIRQIAGRIAAEYGVEFEVGVAVDDIITYGGDRLVAANFAPAWTTDPDSTFVRTAVDAIRAAGVATEVFHYAFCTNGSGSAGTLGIPTIGFGPGHEDAAHSTDEWISVADLVDGVRSYTALARALTGLSVKEIRATAVSFTRPPVP